MRELPHGDFLYEPKWDGFRCNQAQPDPGRAIMTDHRETLDPAQRRVRGCQPPAGETSGDREVRTLVVHSIASFTVDDVQQLTTVKKPAKVLGE